MTTSIKTSGWKARPLVQAREAFRNHNNQLFAKWETPLLYVVYSYGDHWPLFAWDGFDWHENVDKCSPTTSKHRSQTNPYRPTTKHSCNSLRALIAGQRGNHRSDVSIVFYTTNTETLPLIAIKLWFDENFPKELPPEQVEVGDDYILAQYEGYKWYPDYEGVQMVEAAVTLFGETFECDEGGAAHWETVRVGEEPNDIEYEASPYATCRLSVSRTIHFD